MLILLHSSKTMLPLASESGLSVPIFLTEAQKIARYLRSLDEASLATVMHISPQLATKVAKQNIAWLEMNTPVSAAVETFRGDIYSGLRALDFSEIEKDFAGTHLRILSALYGLLRPYDGIKPYRLEAAYKLPGTEFRNLYAYWGDRLAQELGDEPLVNLTSGEYEKLVLPHLKSNRIVTPTFLTVKPATGEPVFVTVHAKIARGAYARWLIKRGEDSLEGLENFTDLGYAYDPVHSTPDRPVYVCQEFRGLGLSQRSI